MLCNSFEAVEPVDEIYLIEKCSKLFIWRVYNIFPTSTIKYTLIMVTGRK